MKNLKICSLVLLGIFFLSLPSFAQVTETITLDTYYPSPYGVYEELSTNRFVVNVATGTVAEYTAMSPGDVHIGRSLIVGTGTGAPGLGFAYDDLDIVPPSSLDWRPMLGEILVQNRVGIGNAFLPVAATGRPKLQVVAGTGLVGATNSDGQQNITDDTNAEGIAEFSSAVTAGGGGARDGDFIILGTSVPVSDSVAFLTRGNAGAGYAFATRDPDNVNRVKMVIRGDNSRVGINTVNPTEDLDVNGDVHISGDLTVDGAINASICRDYPANTCPPNHYVVACGDNTCAAPGQLRNPEGGCPLSGYIICVGHG